MDRAAAGRGAATSMAGLLGAAHPFPIAMVLVLTAVTGVASSRGHFDPWRLALVLLAMLLSQLTIGWSNDYLDRENDRRFQPEKPLARGTVTAGVLVPCAVSALIGAIIVGVLLGAEALMFLIAGTACGLAYDFGVKGTRLSGLPYIGGFALLPPFVWAGLDVFRPVFLGLYGFGPPLVLAVHLANALPDVAGDRLAGKSGLAAVLGRERAVGLLFGCLAAAGVIAVAIGVWVGVEAWVLVGTVAAFAVLCSFALRAFASGAGDWGFRVVAVAAVALAGGWMAAV